MKYFGDSSLSGKSGICQTLYILLSASCSVLSKQKSEQEQEELLSCHDHAILVIAVENDRTLGIIEIMVHDELNASFSFHGELFWKIMVHCF